MLGYAHRIRDYGSIANGLYAADTANQAVGPAAEKSAEAPKTVREFINRALHPELHISEEQRLGREFNKFAGNVDVAIDVLVGAVDALSEINKELLARISKLEGAISPANPVPTPATPTV